MLYCPTARNFYRIRRILMEMLGLPRNAIRPTSTFAELIPVQECQRVGERLQKEKISILNWHLSTAKSVVVAAVSVLIVVLGLVFSIYLGKSGICLGCMSPFAGIVAYAIIYSWAVSRWGIAEIGPAYTLKKAVQTITSFRDYLAAGQPLTREFISLKVREVIARNFGVDQDALTDNTSFKEDLGID